MKCQIEQHNQREFVAICSKSDCKNTRLSCAKCLITNHKGCNEYILFIDDIEAKRVENLLQAQKFDKIKNMKQIVEKLGLNRETDIEYALQNKFEVKLDYEFEKLGNNIKNMLEDVKYSIKDRFNKILMDSADTIFNLNSIIDEALELDKLGNALKQIETNKEFDSKAVNDNFNEFLKDYWTRVEQKITKINIIPFDKLDIDNDPNKLSFIADIYDKLTTILDKTKILDTNFPIVLSSACIWTFDANAKGSKINLGSDNLTATKIDNSSHMAVFGSKLLETGIHTWSITPSGITKGNGDWIQFGLCENNTSFESFSFDGSWSVVSGTYYGNVTKMSKTGACETFNDKIFTCTFDADLGVFTIETEGFKAETKELKEKKLYPFVNLWDIGNSAKLSF